MLLSDIPSAISLCRKAGWNQTEADWQRILAYESEGCFVAEIAERVVGTVTSTSYSTDLAWIGMMLVDDSYRRRGIATQLMTTCLQFLQSRSMRCIKLDATPLGEPVYEKLGFRSEWTFHRWSLSTAQEYELTDPSLACNVSPESATEDIDAGLDRDAFGVDRRDWLGRLRLDSNAVVTPGGFGMMRSGHVADYLGPVVARRLIDASQIIMTLLQSRRRDVFWDIPGPNGAAADLAEKIGFQPIRDLTRMWIGDQKPACDLNLQYALCDPGTG